jgi:hypothetical protein
MMKTIRVRAKGTGRIVGWRPLTLGCIEVPTAWQRLIRLTTTLPDALVDVIDAALRQDPSMKLTCIVPNGPTSAQLDISLSGHGYQIVCSRRLVRGWFPLNPFAAEFGSNYDLVISADGDSMFLSSLFNWIGSRYEVTAIPERAPTSSAISPSPITA